MSEDNDTDPTESLCDCCGPVDRSATGTPRPDTVEYVSGDGWRPDPSLLEAELPDALQAALGRVLGNEPVGTVGEWVATVRHHVGGPLAVADLCLADGETNHWGTIDGDQYYFRCFYDAVLLSAIVDQPVDVHTVSPTGEVIEARAVGTDELSVSPSTAVFSFGVATAFERATDGDLSHEAMYDAQCPYVKAFPDRDAYERWAAEVPAATVAAPLADATELATGLTAE